MSHGNDSTKEGSVFFEHTRDQRFNLFLITAEPTRELTVHPHRLKFLSFFEKTKTNQCEVETLRPFSRRCSNSEDLLKI